MTSCTVETVTVEHLDIPGAWVYTPKVFADDRGYFFEWFQDSTFREAAGNDFNLAQANCSVSAKGTLRGIHFAAVPPGQRKYVACLTGRVMDVVVDLRKSSPTFGKWNSEILSAENHKVMSIPNGVGHAFMALDDFTTVVYLCDQRYNPSNEYEINPLDIQLGIDWPADIEPILAAKDAGAPMFGAPNTYVE
ncbi:MAG: dTDP-4-dehydrorhamnose 3,5-epimerase [Actinobacteria bacterium]|nr:dTDP-4-dehydrorhamnose 3,5-epimerase [Actinomycetota bacterium]